MKKVNSKKKYSEFEIRNSQRMPVKGTEIKINEQLVVKVIRLKKDEWGPTSREQIKPRPCLDRTTFHSCIVGQMLKQQWMNKIFMSSIKLPLLRRSTDV